MIRYGYRPTGRMKRFALLLIVFALVAGACTSNGADPTTTTSQATTTTIPEVTTTLSPSDAPLDPDGFYLVLMFHQHQPLYPKNTDGIFTRPWVRVHATKDYYDMVAQLKAFPDIKATFNLTPVLMLQLEELANGVKDVYWVLSEIAPADLTEEQRTFITDRFFDTNPKIIARFPRYQELADKRGNGSFTDDDIADLQALFNLAWTDPDFLAAEPLTSVVAKERGYTQEDIEVIMTEHLRIIQEVLPIHREMWDSGNIEVTTTPLAHPILPLIADTNLALVGDSTAVMPADRFNEVNDAVEQVRRGLDEAQRLLDGRRPVGMWPGEGAVAQLVMSLFSREGIRWVGTGEDVLASSLDIGTFSRDGADTVEQPELLYKPWNAQLSRNPDVAMFFRDKTISDQLGFQYSGMSGEAAATDFMDRLARIKENLDATGATGPHAVTVILDGENAWEHYDNDGKDFFNAMFSKLEGADWVRTVTPSQYIDAFGDQIEGLPEVFPGAWFSSNYATWIGEPEEATAWEYLKTVRDDLTRAQRNATADEQALAAAFETMLFAEGSDWFWWYGSDQSSGNDDYFDAAYRELLGQVYDALGQERPIFLSIPIIPETPASPDRSPDDLVTITIDNVISDEEWATAGRYTTGGELTTAIGYGFDAGNLYMRVDFSREVLGDDSAEFNLFLSVPSGTQKRSVSIAGTPLGFAATHLVSWRGTDPVTVTGAVPVTPIGGTDPEPEAPLTAGFDGRSVEFAIPLATLGPVETGDDVLFRLVERSFAVEIGLSPVAGPGRAIVPDISDVEPIIEIIDPTGDDYGPGTYTYPLDPVFRPGSFDLEAFSVGRSGDEIVFTFDVRGTIDNVWDSPNGLSTATFDVYIDKDPGAGTGPRLLIDGRNAALQSGNGWEYAITAEGWEPAIYVGAADGTSEETRPTFKIVVLPDKGKAVIRVPAALLGGGDPATWGYAAIVLGQEGFPAPGVRRIRDVNQSAEQYRFGGGAADTNHTRIVDFAWPEAGIQESALADYPSTTEPVDTLGPQGFARLPLFTAP